MGGFQIFFDTNITGTNTTQSPFNSTNNLTGSPALVIQPIYYAMMIIQYMQPAINSVTNFKFINWTYNSSYNIKVYAFKQSLSQTLGAVIINK
jgi:hypothetical protein